MDAVNFLGKKVTEEMVLGAMAQLDKEGRQGYAKRHTYEIDQKGTRYPSMEIMSIASGVPVGRFAGGEHTNRRFRDLGFKVVQISDNDSAEQAVETELNIEAELEDYVASHLEQIEPGLTPYEGTDARARQLNTGAVGRLDLLATAKNGDLVVIELKAGEADDHACGQIQGYIVWVRENLANGRKVRGIIVANDFTERLRAATRAVPGLGLTKYEVTYHFRRFGESEA
jgi:Endonuclease NucS C-terminal domain